MDRAESSARHIADDAPIAVRIMRSLSSVTGRRRPTSAWHVQNLTTRSSSNDADGAEGRRASNEAIPNFTGAIRQQGEEFPEWTPEQWERPKAIYEDGEY